MSVSDLGERARGCGANVRSGSVSNTRSGNTCSIQEYIRTHVCGTRVRCQGSRCHTPAGGWIHGPSFRSRSHPGHSRCRCRSPCRSCGCGEGGALAGVRVPPPPGGRGDGGGRLGHAGAGGGPARACPGGRGQPLARRGRRLAVYGTARGVRSGTGRHAVGHRPRPGARPRIPVPWSTTWPAPPAEPRWSPARGSSSTRSVPWPPANPAGGTPQQASQPAAAG